MYLRQVGQIPTPFLYKKCWNYGQSYKAPAIVNCLQLQSDNVSNYSVVIRNSCSGNSKTFYLSEGDWMNAHPGDDYCITNVDSW